MSLGVNDHEFLLGLHQLLLAEVEPDEEAVERVADGKQLSLAHIGLDRADELVVDLLLLLLCRVFNVTCQLLVLVNQVLEDD